MLEHIAIWGGSGAFLAAGVAAWLMASFSMWKTPSDWVGPTEEFAKRIRRERILFNFGVASILCAFVLALFCLVFHVH